MGATNWAVTEIDQTGRNSRALPNHGFAKSVLLVLTSLALLPLSTSILIFSFALHILLPPNALRRRLRQSPRFRPKTILVTGVGNATGLRIARAFYSTGHKVIGADFEPLRVTVSGRFSKALSSYHRLRNPVAGDDASLYMRDLVDIVEGNKVDLWISCSEVVSPVEDAQARELLESRTNCQSLQVDLKVANSLGDSDDFVRYTKNVGLPAPELYEVRSRSEVYRILNEGNGSKKYTMKATAKTKKPGVNQKTMLPRRTLSQTYQHVSGIKISKDEPWILQQLPSGQTYSSFSVVVDGEVKLFVAYPGASKLSAYQALPTDSGLAKAMLNFTQVFASKYSPSFTGHLCFSFLVEEKATETGIQQNILPVECHPQVNPAALLFTGIRGSVDLVRAYMAALPASGEFVIGYSGLNDPDHVPGVTVSPRSTSLGIYFIGQDLVSFVLVPILQFLRLKLGMLQCLHHLVTFLNHILFWQEGIYATWDPLPAWWLYHLYMPVQLLTELRTKES